jgi:aspartate aminotransferase
MPSSPIRRLAGAAREAELRGTTVYRLNIGQPDVPTPPQAIEALRHITRDVLEYSPSEGLESLRVKMAEYYSRCGLDIRPDEIIITTGGSEAVLFAFMACLDPGDEIIIPEPAYANYMAFAISAGARIVPVTTTIADGFRLPPVAEFERLITPRTKGILVCNPNNPTGYIYTRRELEAIAGLASRHGLFLFSDEVYREFCYSDQPFVSVMSLPEVRENAVLIDSVSKRYNECGIRIGALVSRDPEVRANVMKFCQARLSPPLLGQIVAEASVDTPEEYMKEVYDRYLERRDYLIGRINAIPGCHSPMPMGAFYTVASLPVDDADEFCRWCLEEFSHEGATVFMAPASGFYTDREAGRDQVRIAYVHDIPYLAAALDTLEAALRAYPGRKA